MHGTQVRTNHRDNMDPNPDNHVVVDDIQAYTATIKLTFVIGSNGLLEGGGSGKYDTATWHLEGTNGSHGGFSCDPNLVAPDFTAHIDGQAFGRNLILTPDLSQSKEVLDQDLDCGGQFTARASTSQFIIQSFANVTDGTGKFAVNETNTALPPFTKHTETTNGDTQTTVDDNWQITVKHDCGSSDGKNSSNSPYINQYDAGSAFNLSTDQYGSKGGNACGPSSLSMATNANKQANGKADSADLSNVYKTTMTDAPQNGIENNFDWGKAKADADGMGYSTTSYDPSNPPPDPLHPGQGESELDFVNDHVSAGQQVLVSTTFTSKPYPQSGGGHVILVTGITAGGDFVVSDPAGDYASGPQGHYGKGKCGANTVYPKDMMQAHVTGRPAIAISNAPGADPEVLLVVARYTGGGPPPSVTVRIGHKVAGWRGRTRVSGIAGSFPLVDPIVPSDPETIGGIDPTRWPLGVLLHHLPSGPIQIVIRSNEPRGGQPQKVTPVIFTTAGGETGANTRLSFELGAGKSRTFRRDVTPPVARIFKPKSKVKRNALKRFLGTAGDVNGIRAVTYTLRSAVTHLYMGHGGGFTSQFPVARTAKVHRVRGRGEVTWSARAPHLKKGGYELRVQAVDGAGNRQVVFKRGRNLKHFGVR